MTVVTQSKDQKPKARSTSRLFWPRLPPAPLGFL